MEKNLGLMMAVVTAVVCVIYLLSQMKPEMDLAALFIFILGISALVSARARNHSA